MKRIFLPSQNPSEWQRLLAKPSLHWKKSHSAMATAACWEASNNKIPNEIIKALDDTREETLVDLKLLAAFPEYEVDLPGGNTSSHTDVLAIAHNDKGLVVLAVEAKVDETFGPTLKEKRTDASIGVRERLTYLHSVLRLDGQLHDDIRYQLLHRTVSALQVAKDFHAKAAVMLVHSFSRTGRWHQDFVSFCTAMTASPISNDTYIVERFNQPRLYLCWCKGDERFLNVELPKTI
jgi:hypothetical protein